MRNPADIQLVDMIVHVIDPRGHAGPDLSETVIPLATSPELADYVATHIKNSHRDEGARAARFLSPTDEVGRVCAALLDGSMDVVSGSQRLAQRLFDIVRKDNRIAPGDLAVCLYRDGADPTSPRYLSLIKIDPSRGFRQLARTDQDGKRYYSFEIATDVMPSVRERLQKGAFIRAPQPDADYDMLVLDRQIGQGRGQGSRVAHFFLTEFLGADYAFDARTLTETFYRLTLAARQNLGDRLDPTQQEALQGAREYALACASIDVDAWVDRLPLPEWARTEIGATLAGRMPDREFEIDPAFGQTLIQKRVFIGDNGLRLVAPSDMWPDKIDIDTHAPEGEPAYTTVTFRTKTWREAPK